MKCGICDKDLSDGSAVMEGLCRECYARDVWFDMYMMAHEASTVLKIDLKNLMYETGLYDALERFKRRCLND